MHIMRMHLTPEQRKNPKEEVEYIVNRALEDCLDKEYTGIISAIIHPTGLVEYLTENHTGIPLSVEGLNEHFNNIVGPDRVRAMRLTIQEKAALEYPTQSDLFSLADNAKVLAGLTVNRKPLGYKFNIVVDELFPFEFNNPIDLSVSEAGNIYGDYANIKEFTPDSLYIAVVDIFD